jgi:hypothetical protein
MDLQSPDRTQDSPFPLSLFPGANTTGARTTVACPGETLITQSLGIEPHCADGDGYPVRLRGPFQYFEVGVVNYEEVAKNDVWIRFDNMTVHPMNYAVLPQMYWGSWEASNADALVITGGLLIGGGGLIVATALVMCAIVG